MRFRTLEIRWHDSKPISSCDFQPVPTFKKARPANGEGYEDRWPSQTYRLATAGEDNHVRVSCMVICAWAHDSNYVKVWMVYPNLHPRRPEQNDPDAPVETLSSRPPRVEYLATLSRHSAAVNVVRWSPNGACIILLYLILFSHHYFVGELIASAGDGKHYSHLT
jgi:chromatin assembly factor 1 subunit B